jgi:hypothetical protein
MANNQSNPSRTSPLPGAGALDEQIERSLAVFDHQKALIDRLDRIVVGIEALNRTATQQTRLLADVSAKASTLLEYSVRLWRGETAAPRPWP